MSHSINQAELLIDKLLNFHKVSNVAELSTKINTSQKTISNWKIRNSVNAIKKKCKELGIYNEIFGDFDKAVQKIEVLEKSLFNDNINKTLEIINTMTKDNKELENKFDQFLKDFVKNNL